MTFNTQRSSENKLHNQLKSAYIYSFTYLMLLPSYFHDCFSKHRENYIFGTFNRINRCLVKITALGRKGPAVIALIAMFHEFFAFLSIAQGRKSCQQCNEPSGEIYLGKSCHGIRARLTRGPRFNFVRHNARVLIKCATSACS